MSQISDTYASEETFPYFNQNLVTPLQIGGLGVQLLGYYSYAEPVRGLKSSVRQLPQGFSQQEFHSPKEPEVPQEQGLEIGYVRNVELSK